MRKLWAEGHSVRWIAEEVGVARGTVANYTEDIESPYENERRRSYINKI